MLCILHCLGLWQEIASSSRHLGSLGSSWPTARVYYWAPDLNIWSKLSNRSDSFLNILLLSINPDINVITIVFLSECYMITPVLCLCIFQSRMPVLNLELNMQNIFGVLYFFYQIIRKYIFGKKVFLTSEKTGTCRPSSVLHCEKTPAIVHPHQLEHYGMAHSHG